MCWVSKVNPMVGNLWGLDHLIWRQKCQIWWKIILTCFEIQFWVTGFDALAARVIALFDRGDQHLTNMLINRCHWIHGAPTSSGDIYIAIWDWKHKGWVAHTQPWPQHINDHGNCVCYLGAKWTALLWDGPVQTPVLPKQASTTVSSLEFGSCTSENKGALLMMSDL